MSHLPQYTGFYNYRKERDVPAFSTELAFFSGKKILFFRVDEIIG
jgi:hypothetical protein